jgi:hypothetical protein
MNERGLNARVEWKPACMRYVEGLSPECRDGGTGRRSGLVNSRMAYMSVSRAQFDVQIYTNDAKALGYELSRDVSHPVAIQQEPIATQKIEPQSESIEAAQGLSVG